MARNSSKSLYQKITDQFIEALKTGAPPWIKPWSEDIPYTDRPTNAVTDRKYTGVNVTILWISAASRGFARDRWLTFNQVSAVGGKVSRGQKGTVAVLYRDIEVVRKDFRGFHVMNDSGQPEMDTIKLIRGFTLFNVEQCSGLPQDISTGPVVKTKIPNWKLHQAADNLIISNGINIRHDNDNAYYSPKRDFIRMPPKAAFKSTAGYYSTLMHELTHWTGHASRLNRRGIAFPTDGEPKAYAFEEMIAEIGSAFLCAEFGIRGELLHESYLLSWIRDLDYDPKAIFASSAQAWKARNFLLDKNNQL